MVVLYNMLQILLIMISISPGLSTYEDPLKIIKFATGYRLLHGGEDEKGLRYEYSETFLDTHRPLPETADLKWVYKQQFTEEGMKTLTVNVTYHNSIFEFGSKEEEQIASVERIVFKPNKTDLFGCRDLYTKNRYTTSTSAIFGDSEAKGNSTDPIGLCKKLIEWNRELHVDYASTNDWTSIEIVWYNFMMGYMDCSHKNFWKSFMRKRLAGDLSADRFSLPFLEFIDLK